MERYERVAKAIEASGKRKAQIARECQVSSSAVTQWLSGESKSLKPESIYALAAATGFNAEWLAMGTGPERDSETNVGPAFRPQKRSRSYPVISWIAAGSRAESPQDYVSGANLWFESDQSAGEDGYWLEVKGTSMKSESSPSFLPGTYVLVQPEGFDLISGKYYIAQHRDGETTFKQYVYDAGKEYLVPLNPAFETVAIKDDWEFIGRVIDVKVTGL
ncbi:LexA family protein [Pseudomonas huanghezhanensis]|uniref:LexA family protein n=1 Tax=Pseudomonas huanghezhanensis TaxID=3002903 RepID=UPI002286CE19|nr:S24 family peptidase [Pseudomonas sp. BSw22131]